MTSNSLEIMDEGLEVIKEKEVLVGNRRYKTEVTSLLKMCFVYRF